VPVNRHALLRSTNAKPTPSFSRKCGLIEDGALEVGLVLRQAEDVEDVGARNARAGSTVPVAERVSSSAVSPSADPRAASVRS
jgi:hypothetical protein